MTDGLQTALAPARDSVPIHLTAENLTCAGAGIAHGFFTRAGGVSEGIYASLNCGRGSNDESERVEKNRAFAAAHLGVPAAALIGPRQVHSPKSVIATSAWEPSGAPEADAVVTATRGLAICVLTADCAPILLADTKAGVVAAAHAGWKGAKGGVIESAIEAMESLGARLPRIAAAIGPCISQAAYEVGFEFKDGFLANERDNDKYFMQRENGRPHFDLPAYVKERLERCGVTNVEDLGICTYENESMFFSYRRSVHRAERDYGRQISAILLR